MELGKFKVYEELGRGGYGTVYRAYDTTLEVERAVKILHPALAADAGFIERFQREARVAARLEHPHIVPVYEVGEEGGYYYLVMKYMAGGSLKELLEKNGRLPYETALEMVGQIGSALEKAHSKGLVHCDVKPGNILLEEDGTARLADFGFARAMQSASSDSLSRTDPIVGTSAYMAPELWNDMEATPVTDLYSLACVLYEMLVGEVLFSGKTSTGIMKKHIMDRPQYPVHWPQDVPGGIEGVFDRALAKEPAARYGSIGKFLDALQGVVIVSDPAKDANRYHADDFNNSIPLGSDSGESKHLASEKPPYQEPAHFSGKKLDTQGLPLQVEAVAAGKETIQKPVKNKTGFPVNVLLVSLIALMWLCFIVFWFLPAEMLCAIDILGIFEGCP